ncbi:MAG TPA: hypothetical protein VM370_02260 [Candidatus Thermoplasmatota archaeon]|nr:hypothetical protein [Candidatus Thermoplasmatota archaeon]
MLFIQPAQAVVDPVGIIGDNVGEVPLIVDVWVDGQHSVRTVAAGIPLAGELNNVAISIIAEVLPPDLILELAIVPAVGGPHVIGVGYNGVNGGVAIAGPAGQLLDAVVTIRGVLANVAPGVSFGSCETETTFELGHGAPLQSSAPNVTGIIFTKGHEFSENDSLYVHAEAFSDLYGQIGHVRTGHCPGFYAYVDLPANIGATIVKFEGDWRFDLTDAPTGIRVDDFSAQRPDLDGGYRVLMDQAVSGSGSGRVWQKVSGVLVGVPLTIEFKGLRSAAAYWDSANPWLHVRAGPQFTGDFIKMTAVGKLGFTATKLSSGNVRFANVGAIDNTLAPGTCASAFFTAAEECAE